MLFWLTAIVTLLADQATKAMARMFLVPGHPVPVLPPFFYLTYVKNPGAAFGLFAHQTAIFIVIAVLVVLAAIVFYRRIRSYPPIVNLAMGLILGGACGNLIDRAVVSQVTDFLDFRVWPVFNVADCGIVVGAALLILSFFGDWRGEEKRKGVHGGERKF